MNYQINKDLEEAYNRICVEENNKVQKEMHEIVTLVTNELISEGYNLDYEEVYQICLDEGIPGIVKSFISGVSKGSTSAQRSREAVRRAREAARKAKAAQTAQSSSRAKKAGEVIGKTAQRLKPGKRSAPILGTAAAGEFALSGQATGDGKSVAAGIPAAIVGGTGDLVKQIGRPLTAVGYPGIEKIGDVMKSTGTWMSGGSPSSKNAKPKPSASKQERNPYGLNQSVDLFDLIKGYLLDEGFADTEDQAHAIMANMSNDWKESIFEQMRNDLESPDYKISKEKMNTAKGKERRGYKGDKPGYDPITGLPLKGV